MQSRSKCNKGIKYLLCAIDLFSKYAWVVPLKEKRRISTVLQKIISKGRKAKKIWVDPGGEFYNKLFKMDSTFNEEKSVVTERFIRALKNKILNHMTVVSKNVYFDVLDNIVDKYDNKHRS